VLLGLGIVGVSAYALIQFLGFVRTVSYYRVTRDPRYALLGGLLLLGIVGGLAESTLLVPTMQTFVQFVTLAQLAFQAPAEAIQQRLQASDRSKFSAPPLHRLRLLPKPAAPGEPT